MGLLQPDVRHGGRYREARLSVPRRAITIHSLRQALAAAAAAVETRRPILLLSAPSAAAAAGPGWFSAVTAEAAAAIPEADIQAMVDCGTMLGHALAALRGGCNRIRYDGPSFEAIADIARQYNATVLRDRPEALDLRDTAAPDDDETLREACRRWLDATSPSS